MASPPSGFRLRLRRVLITACVAVVVSLGWRAQEVAGELGRERRAGALYREGVSLYMRGEYGDAAARFRHVILLTPLTVEAYGSLADAQVRRGDFAAAVQAYRSLLRMYPYTYVPGIYHEVGIIELHAGRLQDARADLEQAVALDPQDWHAYYLLGHAYRRLGDLPAARAAWRRVLILRPDYQPVQEQLRALDR